MPLPPDTPPHLRDAYEERAAILEYDAGMPRAEAERAAEMMIRRQWMEDRIRPPKATLHEARKEGSSQNVNHARAKDG